MVKQKKVIFCGLDYAGKTSIILSIQKKFSFLSGLRPTLGINRDMTHELKFLGLDLITWDLGGQKTFRDSYLEQRFRIFGNVSTMFYVIDIQNKDRFEESLEYLQNIFDTFLTLNEKPQTIICFNKMDPDIPDNNFLQTHINYLQERISQRNIQVFPMISFFQTSIYDISTITRAFSAGVIRSHPKARLFDEILRDYAKTTFSSAVSLYDENLLIIGSHSSDERYANIVENIAPRFIYTIDRMNYYNYIMENVIFNLKFPENELAKPEGQEKKGVMIFLRNFKTERGLLFTIVSLTQNKNIIKLSNTYLPELAKKLINLIQAIEQS
jgi:GTPase SAR1 family protein